MITMVKPGQEQALSLKPDTHITSDARMTYDVYLDATVLERGHKVRSTQTARPHIRPDTVNKYITKMATARVLSS